LERFHDKPPLGREPNAELVGPYAVLAEIARGELSTVYLAKRHGALGFPRLCALKRLKPALSKSPDWVELLLDEARLISGIRHTNIASVLDVGADAGNFVVMEYIEGENLETLLAQAGAARHPRYIVPPFVDVLHGLHALHGATEEDGSPCGIVHQAPRARHIQIGIDGSARLIDFSQMRAKSVRPTRSRNDRLKVAYMAPEQALHPDGVDLRADLFIVGVSLWEALTGERLFAADTDEQTFQNLLHRRIARPSEVGLRPPRCFDAVCMRALERDPKLRYASALEMARELRDTAQQQALYANPEEVGRWVRHLVGKDLRERRRLAGQDTPSSNDILLETPASGLALPLPALPGLAGLELPRAAEATAWLSDGLTALPGRVDALEDDPYATGRIYGGSEARIALDQMSEHDKTPAFGLRRGKPLAREEEDDEPTGQHVGSGISSVVAQALLEERARAATGIGSRAEPCPSTPIAPGPPAAEPQSSEATPARGAPSSPPPRAPSAARGTPTAPAARGTGFDAAGNSSLLKVAREDISALRHDDEQTQPAHFVPARPGARRDVQSASPGAYSQVDSARRTQRTRASGLPPAKPSIEMPFDDIDTERRAFAGESPAGSARASSAPAAGQAAQPARAARRDRASAMPPPVPLPAYERRNAITEHPPMFVQRRDSVPTRLEIPTGPIGAPHKHFSPELLPAKPRTEGASFEATRTTWPMNQPVVLPDSLTPPFAGTPTGIPTSRSPRTSVVWLVSGVVAALLLLGVAVGLKQWGGAQAPNLSHAASGGGGLRPSGAPEPAPQALPEPALPEPKAAVEEPALQATPEAAAPSEAPGRSPIPSPAAAAEKPKLARPARVAPKPIEPAAEAVPESDAPAAALKRPVPRKVPGLPENPY
jgi:serine/threonine-protein kinase